MGYTEANLEAVESAIASGRLTVRIGERLVTYQALSDLIKLRDQIRNEIGAEVPQNARGRAYTFSVSNGL